GTAPYTWSGKVPPGLTLRPSGLLLGAPNVKGTSTFSVRVTDAAGASATGAFSLTVTDRPPPSPAACPTGRVLPEHPCTPAVQRQDAERPGRRRRDAVQRVRRLKPPLGAGQGRQPRGRRRPVGDARLHAGRHDYPARRLRDDAHLQPGPLRRLQRRRAGLQ